MKPRIYKAGAFWWCDNGAVKCWGSTPVEAYKRWDFACDFVDYL